MINDDKPENLPLPHQVQQLINDLLNKRDNVHLRGNYRLRLDALRNTINEAIRKYDNEVLLSDSTKPNKKRR